MKILDVLSEASPLHRVDDGSRAENAETTRTLIRWARDQWLTYSKGRQVDPEAERAFVENKIAMQEFFVPQSNTQAEGLFRKQANHSYRNTYHFDNPNWLNYQAGQNRRGTGAKFNATQGQIDMLDAGGENRGAAYNAGRENIAAQHAAHNDTTKLQSQVSTLARGQTPKNPISYKGATKADTDAYHRIQGNGISMDELAAIDARLAEDDIMVAQRRREWEANKEASKMRAPDPAPDRHVPTGEKVKKKRSFGFTKDGQSIQGMSSRNSGRS